MTSQPADPTPDAVAPERRRLTVRRAPKFVPFLIAGALLGVVAAGILTAVSPSVAEFETGSVFGFFTVLLMIPGAGLGAVVALVLDRVSLRRAETAVVESVAEPEGDDTGA